MPEKHQHRELLSAGFTEESLYQYPLAVTFIPKQWLLVSLNEIAVNVNPGFAAGKHNSNGIGIPHLRPMNIDRDGKTDLSVVKFIEETQAGELDEDDILFNNTNSAELIGKTAVISAREKGFAFSNHMTRICLEGGVSPKYIARHLHFLWMSGYMRHRCTNHVNQASISSKTLSSGIPILLPPSSEQTRIVEKLEELLSDLDAGIAELKAAQKKLGQYRQSLLKAAVDGSLTAGWRAERASQPSPQPLPLGGRGFTPLSLDGRGAGGEGESGAQLLERILKERRARWEAKQLAKFQEQGKAPPKDWKAKYPEPVKPDTFNLPALPEGWAWSCLDQLSEFITSGSRGWADYYANSGATFIRSQNINKDWLDLTDIAYVNPPQNSEGARTLVRRDDLLLTVTGANVGKAARVDVDIPEAYVSQHVALIRPIVSGLSQYLYLLLTSVASGRGQLEKYAYGAGKPGLNLQQVGSVAIPIPPCEEINILIETVVLLLKNAETQELSIIHTLKQSTAQRQNILKAAFSGQLVPQDPNDEPASVLLERIRAEREQQPKPRKGRSAKGAA